MTNKDCSVCKNTFNKNHLANTDDLIICTLCHLQKTVLLEIISIKDDLIEEKNKHDSDVAALRLEIAQLKDELAASKTELTSLQPSPTKTSSHKKTTAFIESKSHYPMDYEKVWNEASYSYVLKNSTNSLNRSKKISRSINNGDQLTQEPSNDGFTPVLKGAKRTNVDATSSVISTFNSFAALDLPDIEDIVLVGDSMYRDQRKYFGKNLKNRRVFSYGGISLTGPKNIAHKVNDFVKDTSENTLFLVEVGTNDVLSNGDNIDRKILVNKYRELIKNIKQKSKSNNICIIGLFPVLTDTLVDLSIRKEINDQLCLLANEEDIQFLSVWKKFAQSKNFVDLFNHGGLHLSPMGSTVLSDMLENYVTNFHQTVPSNQTV